MPGLAMVACKLPHGIVMQLEEWREVNEPVMGGGFRTVKQAFPAGEPVTIAGNAVFADKAPSQVLVGGFAITAVDADFAKAWFAQRKDWPPVKTGQVFMHEKPGHTESQAREQSALRSGFEGRNPDRPMPGIVRAEVK